MNNLLETIINFFFGKKNSQQDIPETLPEIQNENLSVIESQSQPQTQTQNHSEAETQTQQQTQNLNTMTIRIRTNDNLINLLRNGESAAWRVSKWRADYIQNVEIYSFDGNFCLKGEYSKERSRWIKDHNGKDRLIVAFDNGCIYKSNYKWVGQNPIKYIVGGKEEDENE